MKKNSMQLKWFDVEIEPDDAYITSTQMLEWMMESTTEASDEELIVSSRAHLDMSFEKQKLLKLAAKNKIFIFMSPDRMPIKEIQRDSLVELSGAINFLKMNGIRVHVTGSQSARLNSAEAPKLGANSVSAATQKPIGKQIFQENEILRVIHELGYDPTLLPKSLPGKPGVKSDVEKKLNFVGTVFTKAWERLRKSGEIKDDV